MKRNQSLKQDAKGYYYRNLGWLPNQDGERASQPKFLLGRGEPDAIERLRRLERLWQLVEQNCDEEYGVGKSTWDEITLAVGRAIGRGEHVFKLPRQNLPDVDEQGEISDADYAGYVRRMQDAYPVISFIPEEAEAYQIGVRKNIELADSHQEISDGYANDARQPSVKDSRETLHKAIKAYVDAIETIPEYQTHDINPGAQPITDWGFKLKEICLDFLERYEDCPLSALSSLQSIQCLIDYWRNRPKRKGTDRPIKKGTVKNRLTGLKLFLDWLHRTEKFSWRKPAEFNDLELGVKETKEERASRARPDQVVIFNEAELLSLYENATTPLERFLFLLGLNCGCKPAEVGTLRLNEVFLDAPHPHADVLGFQTSDQDSFVKRVRLKTGVYGEFKLWPHTVLGLKWLIERRKRQTKVMGGKHSGTPIPLKPESILLTSDNGLPMYRHFKSGNTCQEIPKCWSRIANRSGIVKGSYSALRRTTTNFLRKTVGGEVANVFLQHGSPFEKDKLLEDYSNRPYAKVFEALDNWGQHLRSLFDSVTDPFPAECKKGGANISPSTIRQIKKLLAEDVKKSEIARMTGVHRTTVYRYVESQQSSMSSE